MQSSQLTVKLHAKLAEVLKAPREVLEEATLPGKKS
jgi:hypothetical protein